MRTGLGELLEYADCREGHPFRHDDLERWGLECAALPFIIPTTTPRNVPCPGCENTCLKPVQTYRGQASIWCDETPALGRITLTAEDMEYQRLDMQALADMLAGLLGQTTAQPLIPQRAYDLGKRDAHTLFLVRGLDWDDGNTLCNDLRIRHANPLLITLAPPPDNLSLPTLWLGQFLRLEGDDFTVDTSRLAIALNASIPPEGNIFRKEGDFWRVCFEGKQAMIKHSNGMVYLDHLLHHPGKDIPALSLQTLTSKASPATAATNEPATDDAAMLGDDLQIDEQTRRSIQAEIERLKTTNPDSSKIETLENYLRGSTFKGKTKGFMNDNERARSAVTQAIGTAVKKVKSSQPDLATHFETHLKTGSYCQYHGKTQWR